MGRLLFAIAVASFSLTFFSSSVRSEAMENCVPRNISYNIGDTKQCDKYYQCTTKGKSLERLCADGFVYSLEISQCEYPYNVNCKDRPILQPSQSTVPECPRSNGFFEFPAEESCQKFYHCLEGQAYEKTCPEGVIFDPTKAACMHPDISRRPDCAAKTVLNFTCPNAKDRFVKLRFGDHDRHAHPKDCRKYFICLKNGKPRVAGCPLGKVFNPATGYCDLPKNVPNCEKYYGNKNITKLLEQLEDLETFQGEDAINLSDDNNNEQETKNQLHEEEQKQAAPGGNRKGKGKQFKSKRVVWLRRNAGTPVQSEVNNKKQPFLSEIDDEDENNNAEADRNSRRVYDPNPVDDTNSQDGKNYDNDSESDSDTDRDVD